MRIHLIGGSGSGKTFIAKRLSKLLQIESYDLDNIFWDNDVNHYGIKAREDVRDLKLEEIISKDSWIIEGVYYKWTIKIFEKADIVFVLRPNLYLQDWRVIIRFLKRKIGLIKIGKKRNIYQSG